MAWNYERRIFVPLVAGVVLAVVVLTSVMFRSSFHLERLRERSVVEATLSLANEKSDRLDKRIIEQDNAAASLTEGDSLEAFGLRWLDVASVQTPTIRAVLVLDLNSQSREVLAYASRAPGLDDDRFRRLLLQQLWPELDLRREQGEDLRHLHTEVGGKGYLLSFWQRSRPGRRLLIVAWHDVPRIVHELFPRLYAEERGVQAASRVNVVDAKGRIVYGPPLSRGSLTLGRPFETTLYKWRVNVSVAAAEKFGAAVERRRILEMSLVVLSSLVVIFGIIVITMAAARERKLAMLKSDFVANVSHELKTPLALVRMFAEMLLLGRAPADRQQKYLEIILSESERLTALIDNVLDFARLERGRASYEFKEGSLYETVSRAIDVCRSRAERQGVELLLSSPQLSHLEEVRLWLDERSLEIAVINLIDNALKYAPESKQVKIEVELRKEHALVSVSDEGVGIPREHRRRIFERFVRGEARDGEKVRGTGIGLSLVQQIAEAHGGRAWVEDGPGMGEKPGSRFVFSLARGPKHSRF